MRAPGEAVRLRVVTLNVWNTQGARAGLRSSTPNCDAWSPTSCRYRRSYATTTATRLPSCSPGPACRPPISGTRWGSRRRSASGSGCAIATRAPHRVVETLDLRLAGSLDVPWATLAALVALTDLGEVLFIAATTSWRLAAEAAREQQVLALSDLDARHRTELPTILAGDFNATPDAASVRYLTGRQALQGRSVHYHDAWDVAGDGPGYTWACENPNAASEIEQIVGQANHRRRVDYVLVGGSDAHPTARCRIRSARVAFDEPVGGVWPSDHYGVVADLEILLSTR
jgi:endonuclease/exonuclease/phosphatase family metal-dependent hydrolase